MGQGGGLVGTQSLQKGVKSSYLSFEKISLLPVWNGLEEARREKGSQSELVLPSPNLTSSSPKGPLVLIFGSYQPRGLCT